MDRFKRWLIDGKQDDGIDSLIPYIFLICFLISVFFTVLTIIE